MKEYQRVEPDSRDNDDDGKLMEDTPRGSEIEGSDLPHRGGRTGVMLGDDYGADLSPDATNRIGSIRSSTGSDECEKTTPPGDRWNPNPGGVTDGGGK